MACTLLRWVWYTTRFVHQSRTLTRFEKREFTYILVISLPIKQHNLFLIMES